ncbi:hypothetical protein [uncultured Legionella sp.]|uniref:hypothetical protein n=1 Tax=uncultured Legionella sp. TaxID=210934 RepID=UPI0026118561|nr:hypothetical protein [uncultured Legionella sp.]
MRRKGSFKGGLDLQFLAQSQLESLDKLKPNEHAAILGRNTLRLLMMGWPESWTELFSWAFFKAIFIQRDPELLKEFRRAFQQGFELLFEQLEGLKLTDEQHVQVQLYLSNCLSLLPYSDLTPYESIKIPQFIDAQWMLVEYYVNPIELTDANNNNLKDHDRVFAYGLEPINHHEAKSHLIFMGTTYPAGQGFIPQVTTDFEAFETVGSSLYLSGRQNILDWLLRQKDKVNVSGMSLGGSLGLLLAVDLGQYLSRVDALNPAGLHKLVGTNKYDRWRELTCKPEVVIQQQKNDPVSLLGVWKSDWEIIKVIPPKDKGGPNPFCDHFLNYAGFAETEFSYSSAIADNDKRRASNLLLYSIGRSTIYYMVISPYNNFVRPAHHVIVENKVSYFILLSTVLGIGLFTSLVLANTLSPMMLLGIFSFWGALGGLLFIPIALNTLIPNPETAWNGSNFLDYANLHNPDLPRNAEMDVYNKEHKIEINLTYKEVHAYYKTMRCLVKNKDFLPSEEALSYGEIGLSKRQLLSKSERPECFDETVSLKTTKAKAVHIKHALTFIAQLGSENEKELKKALEQEYARYRIGKH